MQSPPPEADATSTGPATQSRSQPQTSSSTTPSPSPSTSKPPSTTSSIPSTSYTPPTPRYRALFSQALTLLKTHHLPLLLGLATLLSYLFPNIARSPHGVIRAEYTILYGFIAATFFTSGLSLPTSNLAVQARNWRLHILVQSFSFLITPAVVQIIVQIIIASGAATSSPDDETGPGNKARIDPSILAGLILTSAIPTTIASNVVMTRAAGGSEAAAVTQVLLGNILGPFLTPAWTDILIPHTTIFSETRAARVGADSKGSGLQGMYVKVFKYLALAVYLPLLIGQILRAFFPRQTSFALRRLYIGKVGMLTMILLVWTTMSTCFYEGAFTSVGTGSMVLICLLNVGLYVFFALLIFCLARPPLFLQRCLSFSIPIPWRNTRTEDSDAEKQEQNADASAAQRKKTLNICPLYTFPPPETIAAIFCGPAKTTALGIPLLYAMWTDGAVRARMAIPVVLYTTEQIFVAHFVVGVMRRWIGRINEDAEGLREKKEHGEEGDGHDEEDDGRRGICVREEGEVKALA